MSAIGEHALDVSTGSTTSTCKPTARYIDNLAALSESGSHIRLLRITKAHSRTRKTMQCELRTYPSSESPDYTAISYSWHHDSRVMNVRFKGTLQGLLPISHDLWCALRAFHRWQPDGWLWVDALCVDQSSVAEKNDQVPRMREIYSHAYAVFVWLGSAVARSSADSAAVVSDKAGVYATAVKRGLTDGKVLELLELARRQRAWWCRIWIVQEMVVATRLFVGIGPHLLQWDEFVESADTLYEHHNKQEDDTDEKRRFDEAEFELLEQKRRIEKLDRLRTQWAEAQNYPYTVDLLDVGRYAEATDGRDHIYGLLGLMSPADQQGIRVDYNRSISQVYSEMALYIIALEESFNSLVDIWRHNRPESLDGLLSWIPDYRSSWIHHTVLRDMNVKDRRYLASGDTKPQVTMDDLCRLHVQAIYFDTVASATTPKQLHYNWSDTPISKRQESNHPDFKIVLTDWLPQVATLFAASRNKKIPPTNPLSKLDSFSSPWPVVNDPYESRRHPSEKVQHESKLFDSLLLEIAKDSSLDSQKMTEEVSQAYDMILKRYEYFTFPQERVLFTTEQGFFGSAPHDCWCEYPTRTTGVDPSEAVRRGDIIVVLLGSSVPWVLRKTDVEGQYKLVVECDVRGIMYGELMELVEAGDGGRDASLRVETFVLV